MPHPVHDMNRDVHKILFPFDVIKAVACGSKYRCPFFYLSRTYSCWGTQVCQAWPEDPQGAEHGADDDSSQLVGNVRTRTVASCQATSSFSLPESPRVLCLHRYTPYMVSSNSIEAAVANLLACFQQVTDLEAKVM